MDGYLKMRNPSGLGLARLGVRVGVGGYLKILHPSGLELGVRVWWVVI